MNERKFLSIVHRPWRKRSPAMDYGLLTTINYELPKILDYLTMVYGLSTIDYYENYDP
jgi:hypothetical protein